MPPGCCPACCTCAHASAWRLPSGAGAAPVGASQRGAGMHSLACLVCLLCAGRAAAAWYCGISVVVWWFVC